MEVSGRSSFESVSWAAAGTSMVIVMDNNIFYKNSFESEAVAVTTTGQKGVVFNGVTDWLYRGEWD